ncbi:sensor histidine kinase [Caenimonas aquaedulcis]|uniref:Histidine kinase n=1 Tax=Caenimonas aquaedulcis TaxID=2793270 RepID=A0A931H0Z2_9BURK|nr:histidine kinase [Caenimonas aquaedulcis]MBG9386561.1 histidine kinase [Caenimonas aquaedulcis]
MSFALPTLGAGSRTPARPPLRRVLLPRRRQLLTVVVVALLVAGALRPFAHNPYIELAGETLFVGLMLLFAFNAAGQWRQDAVPRWLVQVIAIAVAAMLSPLIVQLLTFGGDFSAFLGSRGHVRGYVLVMTVAVIIGTLVALGALYSERDAQARAQALQFALEKETLQRQAADARLHLMTAQIQPHFLFNTLANVQELVESGSPRAAPVFRSLIDYLCAAMPRLSQEDATLADEERLVRAYLDLMQMRMPDRLSYRVDIDPEVALMHFPPMALLTLVENAIRHGIDPGCEAGSVEVGARRELDGSVHLWVSDTGVGLSDEAGEGTGLANLNARLAAFFGEGARVELSEHAPHGVRADIRVHMRA